jgi:hypothetical protein
MTIMANPLINDYVRSSHRGLGLSLSAYGFVFGEFFCLGVLFYFTKELRPEIGFSVTGLFVLFQTILISLMIREPLTSNISD